jgi:hypothetical protein
MMSEEERHNDAIKHAWDNGFECGKSSAIPWRKPEERPEEGKACYLVRSGEFDIMPKFWDGFETIEWKYIDAWFYADELPLPDWVTR